MSGGDERRRWSQGRVKTTLRVLRCMHPHLVAICSALEAEVHCEDLGARHLAAAGLYASLLLSSVIRLNRLQRSRLAPALWHPPADCSCGAAHAQQGAAAGAGRLPSIRLISIGSRI